MPHQEGETSPDTASVGAGHDATRHHGALKTPLYETSTYVFQTAEESQRFFEVAYGLDKAAPGEEVGFIYSRLDGPNLRVAEERLAIWEETEDALVFNSGMAAITTLFLTRLRPGDQVLYTVPAYGGTVGLFQGLMADLGVAAVPFGPDTTEAELAAMGSDRLKMVYVETPANPTNDLFDISMASRVAASHGALTVVDNTFLSPVWQHPVRHGADLIVHSATKYLGGHSDLTAGVICGRGDLIDTLRHNRYKLGTTAQPWTAWLLTRSLETLRMRVERQTDNATRMAGCLTAHPKVAVVNHLSLISESDPRYSLYTGQCDGPGAMISFEVVGGGEEAFRFLNALRLIRLTTSLGGTETIISHPWTTSHSALSDADKKLSGVTEAMIRLSVGVESVDDLIADLERGLAAV